MNKKIKTPDDIQKEQQENLVIELRGDKLSPRQELFCQTYVSKEFFGNGVQTYIEVYEPNQNAKNWYKTACASASQILSNIKVYTRINELLDSSGLNDQFVDKQLLFLVSQHEEKGAKLGAIREYNALKKRITQKVEHSGSISGLAGWNDIKAGEPEPEKKTEA